MRTKCPIDMKQMALAFMYEELISKTSYIHSYMLLICNSGKAKKSQFSTQNWLQMEDMDTNWNLE